MVIRGQLHLISTFFRIKNNRMEENNSSCTIISVLYKVDPQIRVSEMHDGLLCNFKTGSPKKLAKFLRTSCGKHGLQVASFSPTWKGGNPESLSFRKHPIIRTIKADRGEISPVRISREDAKESRFNHQLHQDENANDKAYSLAVGFLWFNLLTSWCQNTLSLSLSLTSTSRYHADMHLARCPGQ